MSQSTLSVRISTPGEKKRIKAHAAGRGESLQSFFLRAIRETMYHDTHRYTLDGKIRNEEEERQKYLKGRD